MRQKRFLCLKGIVFAWLFTILLAAGGQHVCFAAEENVFQCYIVMQMIKKGEKNMQKAVV